MLITVTLMLTVPTLLVASTVPVTRDTLEMESHVGRVSGGKIHMHCSVGLREVSQKWGKICLCTHVRNASTTPVCTAV